MGPAISDSNKRLILLSVMQLSGGHCIKDLKYVFELQQSTEIPILFLTKVSLKNIHSAPAFTALGGGGQVLVTTEFQVFVLKRVLKFRGVRWGLKFSKTA